MELVIGDDSKHDRAARDRHGKIKPVYSNIFVNEIGYRQLVGRRTPHFPVGSIIVREKLASRDADKPDLVAIMIKRAPGFNRRGNNWEFIVRNENNQQQAAATNNYAACLNCHRRVKDTDFVFRSYLSNNTWSRMK